MRGSALPSENAAGIHPLILLLERRDRLSPEERRAIENLPWRIRSFDPEEDLVRQKDRPTESCVMIDGFASRVKSSADGARQITTFYVAGDFVDLNCFVLKRIDHSVTAVSRCRAGFVSHEALTALIERFPHLTRLFWTITEVDAAILRNWIFQLGRRNAVQRLAHLFCEMSRRLETVGLTRGTGFVFPVNQPTLSDMLGLSIVHTNRSVQELRARGLITWQRQLLEIGDWRGLAQLAEFDPDYLYLTPEPR